MILKLSRYSKRVIAFICAFVVMFASIYLTSFNSYASGYSNSMTFNVDYAQPYCSDHAGFLSVVYKSGDLSQYKLYTYFWNMSPLGSTNYSTNVYPKMDLTITPQGIKFSPWCHVDSSYYVNLCSYDLNDDLHVLQTINNSTASGQTYFEDYSGTQFVGYIFGGNANLTSGTTLRDVAVPNIIWNSTSEASQMNSYLYQILNAMSNVDADTSQIIQWLDWTWYEIDTVEEQLAELKKILDSLVSEQEKSNTWLGKIWDSLQELLGLVGKESTEPLPDDEMNDVLEQEDALIGDTGDAESNLEFSVDSNSNSVVWNCIERVLNANPRVFGAFIGIMTLGVVTLLLNR